ncbi:hypothetical protein MNV49_005106 [Pseudohyphozyma bogoriensis]|nr:hypothetical protein MNV49_005106 [Pseudohyphozyma bogoriensis]
MMLASAPPPEAPPKLPVVFDDLGVLAHLAEMMLEQGEAGTVASLAVLTKEINKSITSILYSQIQLSSLVATRALESTLALSTAHNNLVQQVKIKSLDADTSSDAANLIAPLRTILNTCSGLMLLDEDFTNGEWDVRVATTDYPLTSEAQARLTTFISQRCWWEIGAVYELLKAQTGLEIVVFGGAVMDREWEGQSILSRPPRTLFTALRSIDIAQVAHEDTLSVLLRSCPSLTTLRIGFQSIGPTDNDTPRASIPTALAQVASHLTHLALRAPSQASSDTAGLVDECLAVLPRLEVLEFSEQGETFAVPIASSKLLTILPHSLRVLRARGLVSLSTGDILDMLEKPETIPVLEEVDLMWDPEDKEGKWKDRHRKRILDACDEFGIRAVVEKNDEPLAFRSRTMGGEVSV